MNQYIEQLETNLAEAIKASTPITVETVKHDHDEKVEVDSRGTTKRTVLGGAKPQYLPPHVPVVATAPAGLPPVPKEVGKVIKENEDERVIKLASGSVLTQLK